MKDNKGFTVIEVLVVLVFLITVSVLFMVQKTNVEATVRDDQRKIAVNAMYYNLEEVYYEKNNYYPQTIDSKILRAMDPELFTDPDGYKMGDSQANYRYEGLDCSLDGKCKRYKLSALMEREAEYVKESRRD